MVALRGCRSTCSDEGRRLARVPEAAHGRRDQGFALGDGANQPGSGAQSVTTIRPSWITDAHA